MINREPFSSHYVHTPHKNAAVHHGKQPCCQTTGCSWVAFCNNILTTANGVYFRPVLFEGFCHHQTDAFEGCRVNARFDSRFSYLMDLQELPHVITATRSVHGIALLLQEKGITCRLFVILEVRLR